MKQDVISQGEVMLAKISELPADLPEKSHDNVVAYGETGGAHALVGGKFELFGKTNAATKYLKVLETAELRHGGHPTPQIAPGVYKIYRQSESTGVVLD